MSDDLDDDDLDAPGIGHNSKKKGGDDPTDAYNVTADELRQFVERFEQLESEKKDISEQQKELMQELKGRGYDSKVFKKVIAIRKRKSADIAEEMAVLEMYCSALGLDVLL
jgi:uncharacterized protein (UPF0335 family)